MYKCLTTFNLTGPRLYIIFDCYLETKIRKQAKYTISKTLIQPTSRNKGNIWINTEPLDERKTKAKNIREKIQVAVDGSRKDRKIMM